jgi:phytoene dehydrogenase-like protein
MKVAVIGAGHQGLVAALTLARAGAEVVVLEQGEQAGGCVWSEQSGSGVLVERGAFEHGGVVDMAEQLGLAEFGLRYRDHPLLAGVRFADGEERIFPLDAEVTGAGLGVDANGYADLTRLAAALFGMLDVFPTPPTMTEVAAALAPMRGGDKLFRTLLQPAEIVIAEAISDPHTRASLELYAAHGQIPPWAPGSGMFALLLPSMHGGRAVRPVGGSAALTDALVAALIATGGQLRLADGVTGLRPKDTGAVVTTVSDQFEVDAVVSSIDLRRVSALIPQLPTALSGTITGLHSGHFNVSELTVSLVYRGRPPVDLEPDTDAVWFAQHAPGDLRISMAEVLSGRLPTRPSSMVASVAQPASATGGALWLSSVVPLRLAEAEWTPQREDAAGRAVVDAVSETLDADLWHDLAEIRVSGPPTWGARLGSDGNPNHLDLSIDQLLGWRPASLDQWRATYPWLWWCGSGVHPGGGLSGTSGAAVAQAVLGHSSKQRASNELRGLWQAFGAYRELRRR